MSNTVKIRKGNKVRYVEAGRLEAFLKQGFEQIDEQGNVVRRATGGSVVPIAKHNRLLEENERLKAEIEQLKKDSKSKRQSTETK